MKNLMMRAKSRPRRRWMIVAENDLLSFIRDIFEPYRDAVEVACFNSPAEAFNAFAMEPEAYEFVITDLEMPDLRDEQLCRRLRGFSPALKVVLSLASDLMSSEEAEQKGFCGPLRKTFPFRDFQAALEPATLKYSSTDPSHHDEMQLVCAH